MTATSVELRMDLFPARVVENPDAPNEATHFITRLLVGLDEVWVWEMIDGAPVLVINERYEEVEGRRTTGWTMTLGDGRQLYFKRANGCGCGNPLRGWMPPFVTSQGPLL